jgi:catechol 2,3-dioxygenase-like lactoylglutathione lyase family enzyme
VSDFAAAKAWYTQLLGAEPAFMPHDTEAVWELAENRYVFIVEKADGTGHADHTLFVDDLGVPVAAISARGIEPSARETYWNGGRQVIDRDAEGNEIGFGGAPAD